MKAPAILASLFGSILATSALAAEVSQPRHEVIAADRDGVTLAWTTSLERLPNGNLLIGNCHAGPGQPQLVEVDRRRRVAWTFHDFERFGNATAATASVGIDGVIR